MKKITTVLGDIDSSKLGITTMHDHTFVDLRIAGEFIKNMFPGITSEMVKFEPENYGFLKTGTFLMSEELQVVDDIDYLVKEYNYFKALGGNSVVDPGPIGCRGPALKMKEFSERTGLNLICATGVYTAISRPLELLGKDEDFLYKVMKRELLEGIDGTDIKPGVIKAAIATCTAEGVMDSEIAGVRAGARLSAETGLSLHIHTDPFVPLQEVIRVVKMAIDECGTLADKVVVCHTDSRLACSTSVEEYLKNPKVSRNIDVDMHERLLQLGANIGLDTWGMPIINPAFFATDDIERVKALITLIDLGYENQIVLGNDFGCKLSGKAYGGYGCTRFLEFGISMLKQMGKEASVQKLIIGNPARILSY